MKRRRKKKRNRRKLAKLKLRFMRLPLHHIDTSIVLEMEEKTEEGRYCKRYLNLLGKKFRGKFSILMLGELMLDILSLEYQDMHTALDLIDDIIEKQKIEFFSVESIVEICKELEEVDRRQDPIDKLLYACAVKDKAKNFVTTDKKMLRSKKLVEVFGVKISHPKEFI